MTIRINFFFDAEQLKEINEISISIKTKEEIRYRNFKLVLVVLVYLVVPMLF